MELEFWAGIGTCLSHPFWLTKPSPEARLTNINANFAVQPTNLAKFDISLHCPFIRHLWMFPKITLQHCTHPHSACIAPFETPPHAKLSHTPSMRQWLSCRLHSYVKWREMWTLQTFFYSRGCCDHALTQHQGEVKNAKQNDKVCLDFEDVRSRVHSSLRTTAKHYRGLKQRYP